MASGLKYATHRYKVVDESDRHGRGRYFRTLQAAERYSRGGRRIILAAVEAEDGTVFEWEDTGASQSPLRTEGGRFNPSKRKKKMASGSKKLAAWVRSEILGKKNPGVKLARTGHTGFLKARAVDVITRGGKVVEVRVKR